MKLVKTASGKTQVKLSKKEWESIGKKAGWMKEAGSSDADVYNTVEKWIEQTGNPYVIDKWVKHYDLALRASQGDTQAWNELVAKCGGTALNLQGQPGGNRPLPNTQK